MGAAVERIVREQAVCERPSGGPVGCGQARDAGAHRGEGLADLVAVHGPRKLSGDAAARRGDGEKERVGSLASQTEGAQRVRGDVRAVELRDGPPVDGFLSEQAVRYECGHGGSLRCMRRSVCMVPAGFGRRHAFASSPHPPSCGGPGSRPPAPPRVGGGRFALAPPRAAPEALPYVGRRTVESAAGWPNELAGPRTGRRKTEHRCGAGRNGARAHCSRRACGREGR